MNIVAAESGDFVVPPVQELFEFPAIFFEDTLFAFNRTGMLYLVAGAITIGLMVAAFRNPSIVPGKFQAAMESMVEFVREQIVIQVIGPDGLRYVPILTTFFLFILINNLFEVTPFVQFPTTGRMALPALLAIVVWAMFVIVGFKHQGAGYLKNVALPPGVPGPILVIVAPIEIISTFLVRPFTHAIRLFANMMAGHILLAIVFIASNAFFLDFHLLYEGAAPSLPSLPALPLGVLMLGASAAAVAFEMMVAALQAYIFTILAAVYLGGSIHPEH